MSAMSKEQKAVDLDTLFSQLAPQQQPAIVTPEPARAITTNDGCLTCPQCGFDHLHHEGVVIYAGGEDEVKRPVIAVEGLDSDSLSVPKMSFEYRRAPDNPSYRRGAICTTYWCEGCHGRYRLTQSQHKGRTLVDWEGV
jgi:hypothetical protein